MKTKHIMIAALLVLMCISVHWIHTSIDKQTFVDRSNPIVDASKALDENAQSPTTHSSETKSPSQIERSSRFALKPVDAPTADKIKRIQPHPDYAWYTSPTSNGAIKNASGDVIFQASEDLPFVQLKSRPEATKIVIISTNRRAYLVDTISKVMHALPEKAPILNAKGFESWNWINVNQLIAECHVMNEGRDPKTESCCTLHNVSRTVIYMYDCRTNEIMDVELPTEVRNRAFQLGIITADGLIELLGVGANDDEQMSIGWFSIMR